MEVPADSVEAMQMVQRTNEHRSACILSRMFDQTLNLHAI